MDTLTTQTEALGIHQSDVVIRTAIIAALADLRANPQYLDYVFAGLAQDNLTLKDYGQKEIQRAKDWFLKTNIPVFMVPRIDEAKVPCISIALVSSEESEVTLGDKHWDPEEPTATSEYPPLAGPFGVVGYDPSTGVVLLPASATADIPIVPGMFLMDDNGTLHEIQDVVLENATFEELGGFPLTFPFSFGGEIQVSEGGNFPVNAFLIEPGLEVSFEHAYIKGIKPPFITQLESVWYREQYRVGVHVSSEPVYLTWLHSIIVFVLLKYKQDLLEARGFERSVFSSSDFDRTEINEGENVFSRYVSITGNVRHYWPKSIDPTIQAVASIVQPIGSGNMPPDIDVDTQLWIGDQDTLGKPKT